MSKGIDYKKKYENLRANFIDALNFSFRTGYEQGFNEATVQSAMQQAQMMQQAQAQQMGQEQPGQPEEMGAEGGPDELDQAIAQLEGLIKSEDVSAEKIARLVEEIKTKKIHKTTMGMIEKSSKNPKTFNFSESFRVNMPAEQKRAVSAQNKIVEDIMRKWETEESSASKNITDALGVEAILKSE